MTTRSISIPLLSLLLFALPISAPAQKPETAATGYFAWAQEFLHAMYPSLNGKKYSFTLEGYGDYDHPNAPIRFFSMSIGEGPKGQYVRVIGGYEAFAPPPKDFHLGPQYYKQFLDAGFTFDENGRLMYFEASGPVVDKNRPGTPYGDFLDSKSDPTLDEVNAELKSEGAKYGPGQQAALEKGLPLETLSHFLGKVQVIKVEPVPVGITPSGVVCVVDWSVSIRAQQRDGSMLAYILAFDQFDGSLFSLYRVPNSQVSDTTK